MPQKIEKNKSYIKKSKGMTLRIDAFSGKLSFSAMGIYGMFIYHHIFTLQNIIDISSEPEENILGYFQELIEEGLIEEVEND